MPRRIALGATQRDVLDSMRRNLRRRWLVAELVRELGRDPRTVRGAVIRLSARRLVWRDGWARRRLRGESERAPRKRQLWRISPAGAAKLAEEIELGRRP